MKEIYKKMESDFEELWSGPVKERCRDSLAPAFIYLILEQHTSRHVHYTHVDIMEKLEEYPYELSLTRCWRDPRVPMMDYLERQIIVGLAGAAASEQVFGRFDSGCSKDLDQAFDIVWKLVAENCVCGSHLHSNGYDDSAELKARQEQATAAEMEKYYRKAKSILTEHREQLDKIAQALLDKGILAAEEIRALVSSEP